MEKYSFSNPITNNSALNLGRFYSLVYKKHIDSYGQIGADNIVDNVKDMYKRLLNQFESDTKITIPC